MKRSILVTLLAGSLVSACNGNSNTDNAKTDAPAKGDTSITTDSRRNAPGTYNVTTDTGNKTRTGEGVQGDPEPTHPAGKTQ